MNAEVLTILGPAGSGKTSKIFDKLSSEKWITKAIFYVTKFRSTKIAAEHFRSNFNAHHIIVKTLDSFIKNQYQNNIDDNINVLTPNNIVSIDKELKNYYTPGIVFEVNNVKAILNNIIFAINVVENKNVKEADWSDVKDFLLESNVNPNLINDYKNVYEIVKYYLKNGWFTFSRLMLKSINRFTIGNVVFIVDEAQIIFSNLLDVYIKKVVKPDILILTLDINQFYDFFGADYELIYNYIRKSISESNLFIFRKIYRYGQSLGNGIEKFLQQYIGAKFLNDFPKNKNDFFNYNPEYNSNEGLFRVITCKNYRDVLKTVREVTIRKVSTSKSYINGDLSNHIEFGILANTYTDVRQIIKILSGFVPAFFLRDDRYETTIDYFKDVLLYKEGLISYKEAEERVSDLVFKKGISIDLKKLKVPEDNELTMFLRKFVEEKKFVAVSTLASSPGITFDNVIVIARKNVPPKVLYTALTRAREEAILIIY